MSNESYTTAGAVALRASLGLMYFTHGAVLKLATYGMAGTAAYFESIGLPGWTAYAVVGAEIVGGLLLMAGVAVAPVALALLPILAGATVVHAGNGWVFSNTGGGWEYPAFLMVASVVVALQHAHRPLAVSVRRTPTADLA